MIVDFAYFTDEWKGTGLNEDEFGKFSMRAENVLNALTGGAFDSFSEFDEQKQKLVKKAICSQIEYYQEHGFGVGMESNSSFTVGKVSVSESSSAENSKVSKLASPLAVMFLEQAGLLVRRVSFC